MSEVWLGTQVEFLAGSFRILRWCLCIGDWGGGTWQKHFKSCLILELALYSHHQCVCVRSFAVCLQC